MKIIILPTLLLALVVLTTTSAEDRKQNHGPCRLGFKDGRTLIKKEWVRNLGENCDEIWHLQENTQLAANRKYRRGRTRREREFNRCARLGVNNAMKKFKDKCLKVEDTSEECFDLAQAAAEAIVQQNVCDRPETEKVPPTNDFMENCRTMGTDNCRAQIWIVIDDWCSEKDNNMMIQPHLDLERKCGAEVDRLIRND